MAGFGMNVCVYLVKSWAILYSIATHQPEINMTKQQQAKSAQICAAAFYSDAMKQKYSIRTHDQIISSQKQAAYLAKHARQMIGAQEA